MQEIDHLAHFHARCLFPRVTAGPVLRRLRRVLAADRLLERAAAEGVHDAPDPLLSRLALEDDRDLVLRKIPVLFIQFLHGIQKAHTALSIIRRGLGDQYAGSDAVLVPDRFARRAADAFLIAKEVGTALLFQFRDPAADILEAGQGFVDLHPVVLTDGPAEIPCHNGFDHRRLFRERSVLFPACGEIGDEEGARLVAV